MGGYCVRLARTSPFTYCDDPVHGLCHSGNILAVLEPSLPAPGHEFPAWLLRDTLFRSLPCALQYSRLRTCLERHVLAVPPHTERLPGMDAQVETFLTKTIAACEQEEIGA